MSQSLAKPRSGCIIARRMMSFQFPQHVTCYWLVCLHLWIISFGADTYDLKNCRTFLYLELALYSRISKITARCIWADFISPDKYFNSSLKKGIWGTCGNEETMFRDEIASNFQKDFIRNSLNKETLYQYLAGRFIVLHSSATQILVVTYSDAILKIKDVPN